MRNPIDLLTPGHVTLIGRAVAAAAAFALGFGYVSNSMTPEMAGIGSFFLACALLLGAPRQRATEMLGAVTVWQCFAEFLSTIESGTFAMWRLGDTGQRDGGDPRAAFAGAFAPKPGYTAARS